MLDIDVWGSDMSPEDRFESLSLTDIDRFVKESQEENLTLEFKTVLNSALNRADDKKNYATALSGFANSAGGLIVWGVIAKRNERGVDCACATQPIVDLHRFVQRLNELEGDAVSPAVARVRHKPLESAPNSGFAVTLVPESMSSPHMAKLGENRYYKRSGDSFYIMEHFDLEDMFGRRKKPKLEIVSRVLGQGHQTTIVLGISNSGRASAKAPFLGFVPPSPFQVSPYGIDGNCTEGMPRIPKAFGEDKWVLYGASATTVIHPGTTLEIARLYLGLGDRGTLPPSAGIIIQYKITAEDIQMVEAEHRVVFP